MRAVAYRAVPTTVAAGANAVSNPCQEISRMPLFTAQRLADTRQGVVFEFFEETFSAERRFEYDARVG